MTEILALLILLTVIAAIITVVTPNLLYSVISLGSVGFLLAIVFLFLAAPDDDGFAPSNGNADSLADAGETVQLPIALRNTGQTTATGVSATLVVEVGMSHVTVLSGTVAFADITVE